VIWAVETVKLASELRQLVDEALETDDRGAKLAMMTAAGSLGYILAGKILESEGS
jgi:hypothetical protein